MFRSRKRSFVAFLTPALLMIICIQFLPMAYNVVLSFLNIQLNKPNLPVEFVGFDNYASILTDSGFWNSVIVTLIIGISSTVLQLVLGLTLALLLDIKGRFGKAPAGMGFFRGLLFIPLYDYAHHGWSHVVHFRRFQLWHAKPHSTGVRHSYACLVL